MAEINDVAAERGREQAEALTQYLDDMNTLEDHQFGEHSDTFERYSELGNSWISAFYEGFHSVYIPWMAKQLQS